MTLPLYKHPKFITPGHIRLSRVQTVGGEFEPVYSLAYTVALTTTPWRRACSVSEQTCDWCIGWLAKLIVCHVVLYTHTSPWSVGSLTQTAYVDSAEKIVSTRKLCSCARTGQKTRQVSRHAQTLRQWGLQTRPWNQPSSSLSRLSRTAYCYDRWRSLFEHTRALCVKLTEFDMSKS